MSDLHLQTMGFMAGQCPYHEGPLLVLLDVGDGEGQGCGCSFAK